MNSTKIVVPMLIVLCVVCVASPAGAAYMDVRVDLNTVHPTPAGWNPIVDLTGSHTLYDYVTSLDSGATLEVTNGFNDSGYTGVTSASLSGWSNPAAPWIDNEALRDYFFLNSAVPGQITLAGLDPGSSYRVELLAVRDSNGPDTEYRVNSDLGWVVDSAGVTTTTDTSAFNSRTDGFNQKQIMLWEAVAPTAAGLIVIDVQGSTANTFFNALRLSAVPEPSTLSLLAVGGLAMLGGLGVRSLRRTNRRR